MSNTKQASAYLILERDSRYPQYRPPLIVGMRKGKPSLSSGQIAVKVTLNIPMSIFDTFIPVVEADISEPDVIAPSIEVEPEVAG